MKDIYDTPIVIVSFLTGVILSGISIGLLVNVINKKSYQTIAIQNQCGFYDSVTGEFKWKNEAH